MPSTDSAPRRHGPPRSARALPLRLLPLAFALALACGKAGNRPAAPSTELHYPAWLATTETEGLKDLLFAVNLDQDLAYDNGSLVSLAAAPAGTSAGPFLSTLLAPVPNMAGKLLVVDDASAGACAALPALDGRLPLALVAGRTEEALLAIPLRDPAQQTRHGLVTDGASHPYGLGLSCSADGKTLRAWVGYQAGVNGVGYLSRVDLATGNRVTVNLGAGRARNLAYDPDHDRLYVTTQEVRGRAPIRWLTVGQGCIQADNGVQDERDGGCHVDPGFDLSLHLAGAEPNGIALSSGTTACTLGTYKGQQCRRMYLTLRMYDADRERLLGERPPTDVGGKLVVLELPESGLGGPDPQWVRGLDMGMTAGELLVLPRTGRPDLVVATALEDDLVWVYDDETGTMAKVFGRDVNTGVPELGHYPAGLAAQALPDGLTTRVFVSSYHDGWVSAIDVPLDAPETAYVVHEGGDPKDTTKPVLHLGNKP
jgi:hypothetical protein